MILNINKINSITPHSEQSDIFTLDVDVELSEGKAEKLFYKLWSEFGDQTMEKWLNTEGYVFRKIEE